MTNDNIYILNAETGEEIVRPMTDKEQAERNAQIEANAAAKAEKQVESAAKQVVRETVLEKLGLTAEEAKLLLG